jgi:nucleotide-binding universal stress UspA family protein
MVTLVATTTLQNAYAWSLYVALESTFGKKLAIVEIMGPFGYSDTRTVSTGPNATVNFSISDSAVPYGYPFRFCSYSTYISQLIPLLEIHTLVKDNIRKFSKILVAIDGSDNSSQAASLAIDIASKHGSELLVIHVLNITKIFQAMGFYGIAYSKALQNYVDEARMEAGLWFEKINQEAKKVDVNVKTEVIEGPFSLVAEIVNYAEQNKVDILIIGSKGRTGFKKLLLGSVASGVVTYATCPVMVVK